jgi:hypothetical protein
MIRYDFDVISDPQPPKPVRPPQSADAKPPGRGEGMPVPETAAGKQPAALDPPAADGGQ